MKFKVLSFAAVTVALLGLSTALYAENHVEITVKNDSSEDLTVHSFDGDDPACQGSNVRQSKNLSAGETKTIKCQGKGHHRCKLGVEWDNKKGKTKTQNWCDNPARDKSTCRISRNQKDAARHFGLDCD